ncbi:E3 ubiquitin-protein ligase rnf8 [Cichlidogyrus casuarinus]|uniref:E3 ubiquitin-protein ligase rnf8 n=1 Tax=Cichlidogyrus casuarinus TaxID=1844966 RepID=A0ABD2QF55_9PLAT
MVDEAIQTALTVIDANSFADVPNRNSAEPKSDLSIDGSDRLDKLVKDHFSCPVCGNILAKVHSLNCGHNFCYLCISKWRKHSIKCPICRETIDFLAPSNNTDAFLQSLVGFYGSNSMKHSYRLRLVDANEALQRLTNEGELNKPKVSSTTSRQVQT